MNVPIFKKCIQTCFLLNCRFKRIFYLKSFVVYFFINYLIKITIHACCTHVRYFQGLNLGQYSIHKTCLCNKTTHVSIIQKIFLLVFIACRDDSQVEIKSRGVVFQSKNKLRTKQLKKKFCKVKLLKMINFLLLELKDQLLKQMLCLKKQRL